MRLFLALVPPENLRAGIHALGSSWRRAHPDLKWVPPENYHFTLRFIGETATELLPDLEKVLSAALSARPSFAMRLGGLLRLPAGVGARVLAMDLADGAAELGELAARIEEALPSLGVPAETRSFRAHLTLARTRRGDGLPDGLAADSAPLPPQPVWRARAVSLIESRLHPQGAEYRILTNYPLAT